MSKFQLPQHCYARFDEVKKRLEYEKVQNYYYAIDSSIFDAVLVHLKTEGYWVEINWKKCGISKRTDIKSLPRLLIHKEKKQIIYRSMSGDETGNQSMDKLMSEGFVLLMSAKVADKYRYPLVV